MKEFPSKMQCGRRTHWSLFLNESVQFCVFDTVYLFALRRYRERISWCSFLGHPVWKYWLNCRNYVSGVITVLCCSTLLPSIITKLIPHSYNLHSSLFHRGNVSFTSMSLNNDQSPQLQKHVSSSRPANSQNISWQSLFSATSVHSIAVSILPASSLRLRLSPVIAVALSPELRGLRTDPLADWDPHSDVN